MESFRPLSGKWGYRYTQAEIDSLDLETTGFRPLSGKWGYRSEKQCSLA